MSTAQVGWQCPVCKTVWAPSVQKCGTCSPVAVPDWTWRPPWPYNPYAPAWYPPMIVWCKTTGNTASASSADVLLHSGDG